ncbi:MAG: hypothetical protein ACUVRK_05760 [Spirochaetota bacterium]
MKCSRLMLMIVFFFTLYTYGIAQENFPMQISGVGYFDWKKDIQNSNNSELTNTFEINRVYLNFIKKFDTTWSLRFTTDIGQVESKGTIETPPEQDVNTKTYNYAVYLKFAYVQAAQQYDNVAYTIQFGMVGTPLLNYFDDQSDYRWIQQNYFDNSKELIGTSVDYSADLGVRANVSMFKVITITGAITNGEGFKHVSETDDGKAYYGMVTLTPFKQVSIIAFDRYAVTNDNHRSDNFTNNAACGAFYTQDVIKIGIVYSQPIETTNGSRTKYRLLDSYLNVDLSYVWSVPLLVASRFGYGKNSDADDAVKIYSGGIGYRFSKDVRTIVYYQHKMDDVKTKADKVVYIKCGINF